MAITFPSSPSAGDIFTSNGKSWQYVNGKWEAYGEIIAPDVFSVDEVNDVVNVYGSLSAGASASIASDLVVDTNTLVVDSTNNRVGVGTSTPTKQVSVESNSTNIFNVDSTTAFDPFLGENVTSPRVGIGVDNPSNELEVGGNIRAESVQLDFNGVVSNTGNEAVSLRGVDSSISFRTSGSENVVIDSSGNVGIGTTSPSVPLEVNDTVGSNGIVHLVDGAIESSIAYKINGSTGSTGWVVGNYNDDFFAYSQTLGAQALTIKPSGNVGIGYTAPSYKLDVNGTLAINGTSQIFSNWSSGSDIDGLLPGSTFGGVMYTNTSGHFVFGIRDNDGTDSVSIVSGGGNWATDSTFDTMIATFQANGRVGIGSTSTQEKLDVFGNIRIENTNSGGEGAALRIENKGTAANTRAGIYFGVDSGSASPSDTGNAEIICINSGTSNKGILQFRVFDGADNEALKITGNGSNYTPAGGGGSNLANGVAFANAGIAIDKGWASYPGIHVFHTTGYGNTNQSEFRVHGWNTSYASYPARTGSDFSVNFRIDGATYFSSDRRHKTNIIDNPHGLSTILQLQPRKFDRINSDGLVEENNTDILGFIAQEVIEVLPEAVKYYPDEDVPNENGWCRAYSLSDSYIVSTLVNAVKELSVQNDALTARIEALEAN